MTREELESKPIGALRALAKARGVRLRPTLKKREIVALLYEALGGAPDRSAPEKVSAPAKMEGPREAGSRTSDRGEGEARDEKVLFAPQIAGLPREYGSDTIVALVRDPFWLYAHWEVTLRALGEANQRVADPETRLTLRVYDTTDGPDLGQFRDIELFERVGHWYIGVGRPDRTWLIDIGVKSRVGGFATIARSNVVHTPPSGPSSRLDEEWWTIVDRDRTEAGSYDEGRRLPLEPMEEKVQALLTANPFSLHLYQR